MADTNTTGNNTAPNIDINAPYTPKRPAPVVSISINHPIATVFKKIKNFLIHKQTLFSTSFTIKVTPIVAMVSLIGVVGLFGGGITTAFTFGRTVEQRLLSSLPTPSPKVVVVSPIPAPVAVTKEGTIKATYQMQNLYSLHASIETLHPTSLPAIPDASISATPTFTPEPTPTLTPIPVLHYILVLRNGSIVFLVGDSRVNVHNYLNLHVLVSGLFDSTKNTLFVQKEEDIEVLP